MLAYDANGTLNTWQVAILDQLIQNTSAAGSDEADLSLRIRLSWLPDSTQGRRQKVQPDLAKQQPTEHVH